MGGRVGDRKRKSKKGKREGKEGSLAMTLGRGQGWREGWKVRKDLYMHDMVHLYVHCSSSGSFPS